MTLQACMGGFCLKRDTCANYLHGAGQPAERLCQKGRDGVSGLFSVQPIEPEESAPMYIADRADRREIMGGAR